MPLGELGSDSTLPQEPKKKPPKKSPAAPSATSAPTVTSAPAAAPVATPRPVPQSVLDDIGMMTGALTTFESLFGGDDKPSAGLTADDRDAEAAIAIGLPDPRKTSPDELRALEQEAAFIDQANVTTGATGNSARDMILARTPRNELGDSARVELAERDQLQARERRAEALGVDLSGAAQNSKTPQAKAMSWDEYNALTDRQRAAVDFNTMLTKAVKRDARLGERLEVKADEDEIASYNDRVAAIFGEDGGSDVFAPETVALLDQIQFKDENADLDDFLGLKTVIRGRDLGKLVPETGPHQVSAPEMKPAEAERLQLQLNLAENTAKMEQAVAGSAALLDDIVKMMAVDRQEHIGMLGGKPKPVNAPLGYGDARFGEDEIDLDADFKLVFDTLADASNADRVGEILGIAKSKFDTVNPKLYEKFLTYADTRSLQSLDYELPLGNNEAVAKYLTPDEFRAKLGLTLKEKADAR